MNCRYLRVWLAILLVVAALFPALPASAGHWELKYTPNASISLAMAGERIIGIVNPTFGPGRAGELELRLAGVPFMKLMAPPYEFSINPDRPVEPLIGEDYKGFGSVYLREGLDYTIEAFVVERGNKKRSVAPATTFRLVKKAVAPEGPPPLSLTEEQLKKLLKEAFDEGFKRGQESVSVPATPDTPPYATPTPVPKKARVLIRLWNEQGLPRTGVVMLEYEGGERRVEVAGSAEVEIPAGAVKVLVPKGSGWRLAEGQKPSASAAEGQLIVWDLWR